MKFRINSFALHIIAFACMFCDHLWATLIPGNMWLTNIGRIAFPLFAYMIFEGYYHTKNIKKYLIRLLIAAIISEIPFDLMAGGCLFYPYHQNVLWTFLVSLICIVLTEKFKTTSKIAGIGIFWAGALVCTIAMTDYYGFGVLTVALFYYTYGMEWWKKVLQFIGLYVINVILMGGMIIDISLAGQPFEVVQQGFALFAMIPILLYDHKQGPYNKAIKYIYYSFYPLHMLILSLLALYS